jgi:hypothetical protein
MIGTMPGTGLCRVAWHFPLNDRLFVGESSLGPRQNQEIQAFLNQFERRNFPVIPVILPSAKTMPKLPWVLANHHWVDFRTDLQPLKRLIWGITGEKPAEFAKKVVQPLSAPPAYKIYISSPGDVGRERHIAEQVIRRVASEFQDRVEVRPYFWEYEPMASTRDYQGNIPLTSEFDLVICILWKRLGSPLSVKYERPGGGRWRSGTEFELVTAVESKRTRGTPDIFIFKNETKATFEDDDETDDNSLDEQIAQSRAVKRFLREWCQEEQDGQKVFKAALNAYQTLDHFEQVLEKLLVGKLNERFPPPASH